MLKVSGGLGLTWSGQRIVATTSYCATRCGMVAWVAVKEFT